MRVLASDDPFRFEATGHVGTIDAHAAEVIVDEHGATWVSHCGWGAVVVDALGDPPRQDAQNLTVDPAGSSTGTGFTSGYAFTSISLLPNSSASWRVLHLLER